MDSRKPTAEDEDFVTSDDEDLEILIYSARQELRRAEAEVDMAGSSIVRAAILASLTAFIGVSFLIVALWPHLLTYENTIGQVRFLLPCAAVLLVFVAGRELAILFYVRSERLHLARAARNCERAIDWATEELHEHSYSHVRSN